MSTPGDHAALHLVLGPAEHGVARHALELAAAAREPVRHLATPSPPEADTVLGALRDKAEGWTVHLHVTDRLCGSTPEAAAALIERIAAHHRLTVTLHDLPQDSDGPAGYPRRAAAYRRICAAACGVQVCSHHERELLRAVTDCVPTVVPLPVPRRPSIGRPSLDRPPADRPTADRIAPGRRAAPTVGVLGYLYPGKGHAEVLAALDRSGRPEVALVALGRPSDGHEWLVDDLRRLAGGRSLEVTGYLDDAELDRTILGVTVPVMAHTHVSASGSLHRWIGCGRRPVAVANRYTRELAAAMPGALTLTTDLPTALGRALDRPETTWLHPDVDLPGIDAAAAAQTAAIRRATAVLR